MNTYFIAASLFQEHRMCILSKIHAHRTLHKNAVVVIDDAHDTGGDAALCPEAEDESQIQIFDISGFDDEKNREIVVCAKRFFVMNDDEDFAVLFVCNNLQMHEQYLYILQNFYFFAPPVGDQTVETSVIRLRIKSFLGRWYLRTPYATDLRKVLRFCKNSVRNMIRHLYLR